MTPAPTVAAYLKAQTPAQRFEEYQDALQAVAEYQVTLRERASRRRSNGLTVTDQDQPEEAFCLFPARPLHPPLVIVGGMGPLAGAMAFRRACAHFRNSRPVVLYQACSIPDRSTVILGGGARHAPSLREIAARLADAVRLAAGLAHQARQPVRCILACNSAHYFWDLLCEDLQSNGAGPTQDIEMVSLVRSAQDALKIQRCRNALVLTTEGARVGQVFSAPFQEASIAFEEPSPTLGRLLMRAIFEGTKSFDDDRAAALGNQFFETILRAGADYDCVVSGCTEIPLLIDLLRLRGNHAVAGFLSQVRIVDPLEEAIHRS